MAISGEDVRCVVVNGLSQFLCGNKHHVRLSGRTVPVWQFRDVQHHAINPVATFTTRPLLRGGWRGILMVDSEGTEHVQKLAAYLHVVLADTGIANSYQFLSRRVDHHPVSPQLDGGGVYRVMAISATYSALVLESRLMLELHEDVR